METINLYKKVITLLLLLFIFACEEDAEWDGDNFDIKACKMGIEVSTEEMVFDGNLSSQTFSITSKCPWTISLPDYNSWLMLSKVNGEGNTDIRLTAQMNPSMTTTRKATLTVSDGLNNRTIDITQQPSSETLSVSASSVNFDFSGGTSTVTVTSNGAWSAIVADKWCTASKRSSSNNDYTSSLYISTSSNYSYSSRSTTITIKGESKTATIEINQQPAATPTVEKASVTDITKTTAVVSFSFSSPDLYTIDYGVCYSATNRQPETSDSRVYVTQSSIKATYNNTLMNLQKNTTYYLRPYLRTTVGTIYGEVISFTTLKDSTPDESDNPTPNY